MLPVYTVSEQVEIGGDSQSTDGSGTSTQRVHNVSLVVRVLLIGCMFLFGCLWCDVM